MLEFRGKNSNPGEIAAKVLQRETMMGLRGIGEVNYQGWKILDRWAFNDPGNLRALETKGMGYFAIRLLQQQNQEIDILTSSEANELRHNGLVEHEILAMYEVKTGLEKILTKATHGRRMPATTASETMTD